MSGYAGMRRDYVQMLQNKGTYTKEWFFDNVPRPLLNRWEEKFYKVEKPKADELMKQLRLVNHFSLGADPEFVFSAGEGKLLNAESYGLVAGLAFGADNNGRLIELRPAPSRFALDVLASIHTELHWLAALRPVTTGFAWKAGAWSGHDGLGGHIHFGRKRQKLRDTEVRALANITHLLKGSGIFNAAEMDQRLGATAYGRYDDWRSQRHGYEYRALPSYLEHPWQAYLSLVLGKLAVHDPGLIPMVDLNRRPPPITECRGALRTVLAAYKDRDDDARIATAGVATWGLKAMWDEMDFKAAWAIPKLERNGWVDRGMTVVPPYIPAPAEVRTNLYNHLVFGDKLLAVNTAKATWEHSTVPEGYVALQHNIRTRVSPGLGEACHDLLMLKDLKLYINFLNGSKKAIMLNADLWKLVGPIRWSELQRRYPTYQLQNDNSRIEGVFGVLTLSKEALALQNLGETRQLLTSGLLPLCRFGQEGRLTLKDWAIGKGAEPDARSRILF